MYKGQRVSVIIPALNEELAIGKVVLQLKNLKYKNELSVIDEIVVCDNGSTDKTTEVAKFHGANVVRQDIPGYGIACLTAIKALQPCDIVLFIDGDDSCFVNQSIALLAGITNGDDLAIGSRTLGTMEKDALTPVQLFGNGLSAVLIRLLWQKKITDLGPFRAIRYSALKKIEMQDRAFGWTVEMQVKAIQLELKMNEYPVDSKVRIGTSKISGTLTGSFKAGVGILSMIAKLRWSQKKIKGKLSLRKS